MNAPYDSYNYQEYWQDRSFEDKCERIALDKFINKIGKKKTLVDIGGGFGRLCSFYSPWFEKCVVVDPSQKLLDLGKAQAKKIKNIVFKEGALPLLPFKNEEFDVVMMVRVSHHLPDLSPSFREIHRILKKDGYLILEVANKVHFLARFRAFCDGDYSFCSSLNPIERRSPENIRKNQIDFLNHHPRKVREELTGLGFVIEEVLSVSNFRSLILKKIIPEKLLLSLEEKVQKPFSRYLFGPSIFFLAKKENI